MLWESIGQISGVRREQQKWNRNDRCRETRVTYLARFVADDRDHEQKQRDPECTVVRSTKELRGKKSQESRRRDSHADRRGFSGRGIFAWLHLPARRTSTVAGLDSNQL